MLGTNIVQAPFPVYHGEEAFNHAYHWLKFWYGKEHTAEVVSLEWWRNEKARRIEVRLAMLAGITAKAA